MLEILGNEIRLTRGDTAYLSVPITNDVGEEYVMGAGDTLYLTVKKSVHDDAVAFQKIAVGGNQFRIEPTDTEALEFGTYKYDVQLNTGDDVFTIIPASVFKILEEVTR